MCLLAIMASNQAKCYYKRHDYSGSKNRKAARAQLKRYHGECVSREEVWRKAAETDTIKKADNSELSRSSHTLKTYSRVPTQANSVHKDPDNTSTEAQETPLITKPRESETKFIENSIPVDPTVQSDQLIEIKTEIDPLNSISSTFHIDEDDPLDGISDHLIGETDPLDGISDHQIEETDSLDGISDHQVDETDSLIIEKDKTDTLNGISEHGNVNPAMQSHQLIIEKDKNNHLDTISDNGNVNSTMQSHRLIIETDNKTDPLDGISGYRIVDLNHVLRWAFELEKHRNSCADSVIEFISENRNGFNSKFTFQCTKCQMQFTKCNEKEEKLNKSFVWGTVMAGSSYMQSAHVTNLMNIPTMTGNEFIETENTLGKVLKDHLAEQIKVGEAKAAALKNGHSSSDGVPYNAVYMDGVWAKRSFTDYIDYNNTLSEQ